jgi:RNA polymerase sigma-70 factor (ECF subfamily)
MTDADLFEAFVRRYQDMVFATAVRIVGNPTEAEDIAQTVFMRAFQRFDEIGPSPTAGGWLKTVTRNVSLNHLTRYRRRWRFFSELAAPDATAEELDPSERLAVAPAVGDALERSELHEQVERALRRLPDHQRVPLVLFHFEDLSYQDIADALGVSLGKVKTDIHRGREALGRLLKAE